MTYPITGIRAGWGPNNAVPARREIDEWYASNDQRDKDQVNLYIQALANFQNIDVDEKLSFFQVAGIHGQPLVPWDEETTSKTPGQGYCTHDSILFPTWHRPYMLLYEQRIYEEMRNLVQGYPQSDQAHLYAACDSWRLPYWDWAAKKPQQSGGPNYSVAKIVTLPTLDVVRGSGSTENVPNPMYKFSMPNGETMGQHGIGQPSIGLPFETTKGTSRWAPNTNDDGWTQGVENNDDISATLRDPNSDSGDWTQALGTLADAVYRLFTAEYMSDYGSFATARFGPQQPPQDYISLESVHNAIHDMSGGFSDNANGHMASIPVAAFDPIFWLHHCNIDRYLAIFLALRQSDWFDNPDQAFTDDGTWSIQSGAIDTPQTGLAPFHKENGAYLSSDDVRQTFALGYTYPELQPWDPKNQTDGQLDPVKYKRNINENLTQLYDNHTQWALRTQSKAVKHEASKPQPAKPAQKPLPQAAAPSGHEAGGTQKPAPDAKATHDDYVVNVLYNKFALGGHPFKIHIYFDTKCVGSVFNFSTPANTIGRDPETGCINCHRQEAERVQVTGQVPITNALRKAPGVDVTDRESVGTYLKERLSWAVTSYNGERVPLENAGQFITVSVARGQGTHYADDCELSKYFNYGYLPHVTDGKDGGLQA